MPNIWTSVRLYDSEVYFVGILMAKYAELDKRVLRWLGRHREDISTAKIIKALKITDSVEKRHISRRFTQLEDKGVLICSLKRTERFCKVIKDPPKTMDKKRWTPNPSPKVVYFLNIKSIPANNSDDFLLAGGQIEKIESRWNIPCYQIPTSSTQYFDDIEDYD